MKKNTYFIFILTTLIFTTCVGLFADTPKVEQIKIAAIFPSKKDSRWVSDSKYIKNISSEMGFKYLEYYGNDTLEAQIKLVDKASSSGVEVIILPISSVADSSQIIEKASSNNIKVVTYLNTPNRTQGISMHVAFNYSMAGYNQMAHTLEQVPFGTYLLIMGTPTDHHFLSSYKGSIEAFRKRKPQNSIKIIAEPYQIAWKNRSIKDFIKNSIANNTNISSIILPDDSMSLLAAQAVDELKLEPERTIFISGQNLTPLSANYVINGSLSMSTYAHQNLLAIEAVRIAYEIALDGSSTPNDNGEPITIAGNVLPTYYIAPEIINKANFTDAILKKGYMKSKNIAKALK